MKYSPRGALPWRIFWLVAGVAAAGYFVVEAVSTSLIGYWVSAVGFAMMGMGWFFHPYRLSESFAENIKRNVRDGKDLPLAIKFLYPVGLVCMAIGWFLVAA